MHRSYPIEIAFVDDDHSRSELRRLNHFSISFLWLHAFFVTSLPPGLQCSWRS
jgi:hypothetical protein